jgi:hypothetical protein
MEWLQDALEDTQYVIALTSGRMEPIRPWPNISPEQVQEYINKHRIAEPDSLNLETICNQPLGFYLVIDAFIYYFV